MTIRQVIVAQTRKITRAIKVEIEDKDDNLTIKQIIEKAYAKGWHESKDEEWSEWGETDEFYTGDDNFGFAGDYRCCGDFQCDFVIDNELYDKDGNIVNM